MADNKEIVDESSAAPILENTERSGIAADHSHMCKFENSDAPGSRIVVAALMRYARESPALVESRWSQAKEMLRTQRSAEATELTGVGVLAERVYPTAFFATIQRVAVRHIYALGGR